MASSAVKATISQSTPVTAETVGPGRCSTLRVGVPQGRPYLAPASPGDHTVGARRRRLLTRTLPLGGIAVAAFVAGAVVATGPGRAERRLVSSYVGAWAHTNYAQMYRLLDASSRKHLSESAFAAAYQAAATTATLSSLARGRIGSRHGDVIPVRVRLQTRVWGPLNETLEVPLSGTGSSAHVHFTSSLVFPGLRPGEQLTRQVTLPPRAELLARDGTPLAQGANRTSPIPDVASQIVGSLGPIPAADATHYAADGYQPDAKVGLDGLERIFQHQLVGRPGGTLRAGSRV